MPITLYDAFVPTTRQMLQSVSTILGKAEVWAAETGKTPAELFGARLFDDMLPFAFQLRSVARHSAGAIEALRAGEYKLLAGADVAGFADAYRLLADAAAALDATSADELESFLGGEVAIRRGDTPILFTAENFLLSFAFPNFFFHATTAYDVLRHLGMPVGKRDYLGRMRVKA